MHKIRKGDEVMVRAGKDRGKRGTVLRVLPNGRVLVQNINVVKRHTKPNPNKGVTGGILEREASIHVSNVALFNPATGKGGRLGIKTLADGSKVRFFKKTGEVADAKAK
jgi:large subunit ribosomal protein L24